MKVLFFGELPPFSVNGISRANDYYIQCLKDRSCDVQAIVDRPSSSGQKPFRITFAIICFLISALRSPKPFVCYMTLSQSFWGLFKSILILSISLFCEAPIVIHLHRGDLLDCTYGVKAKMIRKLLVKASIILCISRSQHSELDHVSLCLRHKAIFCPNPFPHLPQLLDVYNQRKIPDCNSPRVLYIGPLITSKGLPNLLSQYLHYRSSLHENSNYARLTVAGSSTDKTIVGQVSRLARDKMLTWLDAPTFSAVIPLLSSHDILVLPSLSEGMPYLALEALAAGLFVFVSNVGYISELLGDAYPLYFHPDDLSSFTRLLEHVASLSRDEVLILNEARLSALRYIRHDSGEIFCSAIKSLF